MNANKTYTRINKDGSIQILYPTYNAGSHPDLSPSDSERVTTIFPDGSIYDEYQNGDVEYKWHDRVGKYTVEYDLVDN